MKRAIYSVITNGYDVPRQAPRFADWDSILFTDLDLDDYKGWEVIKIPKSDNPTLQSRYYKIMSHIELKEYGKVCYIDANQRFLQAPSNEPIWFFHNRRDNIFDEAIQIIRLNKAPKKDVIDQLEYYKKQGYRDNKLYLNGFFVRDHSEIINKLHEVWYEETSKFTHRDQLSLPYAMFKTGITPENIKLAKIKEQFAVITKSH